MSPYWTGPRTIKFIFKPQKPNLIDLFFSYFDLLMVEFWEQRKFSLAAAIVWPVCSAPKRYLNVCSHCKKVSIIVKAADPNYPTKITSVAETLGRKKKPFRTKCSSNTLIEKRNPILSTPPVVNHSSSLALLNALCALSANVAAILRCC